MSKEWQVGDWCFCEFKLQQIKEMKDGRITSVRNGICSTGGRDFSDRCFELKLEIKLISEQFLSAWHVVCKLRHPNSLEIRRLLVREWVKTCQRYLETHFVAKQIRKLGNFAGELEECLKIPRW